jgi:Uma2 family endonuclease
MNLILPPSPPLYPDSDGKPLAENTLQLRWIVILFGNLSALFAERADVFVAADLLWYPVEGHPEIRVAPDVLLVFGRPKGHRGSYRQWEEGNVPLTVVFEVLSPGNTAMEMADKLAFYEEHGVEEYYVYDPDNNRLLVYLRRGEVLRRVRPLEGFVSPRLGIRFDLSGPEMVVYGPVGGRFLTFEEVVASRQEAERRAVQETERAGQAERQARQAVEEARQASEQARQAAEQVRQATEQARQATEQARQAERRAARLAELSRKARRGQASAEELQELDGLSEPPAVPPS